MLGPERAENISPAGWLLSRGMMFTTHPDAPVATALKAMTIWAAHQHFEEDAKGSQEVGKLAELRVLETIKEGASVYRAA